MHVLSALVWLRCLMLWDVWKDDSRVTWALHVLWPACHDRSQHAPTHKFGLFSLATLYALPFRNPGKTFLRIYQARWQHQCKAADTVQHANKCQIKVWNATSTFTYFLTIALCPYRNTLICGLNANWVLCTQMRTASLFPRHENSLPNEEPIGKSLK